MEVRVKYIIKQIKRVEQELAKVRDQKRPLAEIGLLIELRMLKRELKTP